ncbi:MAG: Glu-tRNA(Gln) amidotransferase subunit GatD [Methanomicrobiales archaeon]|nr:Glu-tRNA(Gln) amidotransferase subunit GatD [Methanomicrobiales archaeon]
MQQATLSPGDRVNCTLGNRTFEGTYITDRDGMRVVKLKSGYNVGVPASAVQYRETPPLSPAAIVPVEQDSSLAPLSIISTGGTIASRVDYRTGAVTSQFSAQDILRAIPTLATIAHYQTRQVASILSENMHGGIWEALAAAIYDEVKAGAQGVIVTHGTDTMSYSAAAISFMVRSPVPILFVGSQRSADRPSSDNAMNALCSAAAATSDLGEVAVVMHATTNDDRCSIHRATRVRKMHSSRRDAFQSIGMSPLGEVSYPSLAVTLTDEAMRRESCRPELHLHLEEDCDLVYFYPGMRASILEKYRGHRGLVLAGSGLGHVSSTWIQELEVLARSGTTIVMTSQCLQGRVCDRVYDTGRDLLALGVIEGEDMLPETALVKLMWVLGREHDPERVRELMTTDIRGEIRRCSDHGL